MHLKTRFAVLVGALALMLAPATVLAHVEYEVETPPKTKPMPGPGASQAKKAKAYGVYCRAFPKKHVAGTPGTPFSQCVTAMARAATVKGTTARRACRGFSKKHVAGQKGRPYAQCVTAAAKVKQKQRR